MGGNVQWNVGAMGIDWRSPGYLVDVASILRRIAGARITTGRSGSGVAP